MKFGTAPSTRAAPGPMFNLGRVMVPHHSRSGLSPPVVPTVYRPREGETVRTRALPGEFVNERGRGESPSRGAGL